jgi:hypothetical protein
MPREAGYRPYGISASSVSLHLRVIVPFPSLCYHIPSNTAIWVLA